MSLANRILSVIGRAILKAVTDSQGLQVVQLEILDGEVRDDVTRVQDYGLTSNPPTGGECIVAAIGGHRDQLFALKIDGASRPSGLLSGEVALYRGAPAVLVLLKADGTIRMGGATPAEDVSDPVVRKSDLAAFVGTYNTHTHPVTGSTANATANTHTATGSETVFAK